MAPRPQRSMALRTAPAQCLVITGTRAAGKSTLAYALASQDQAVEVVRAVTTREARPDDHPDQYHHLTNEQFREHVVRGELLLDATYSDAKYGILRSSFDSVTARGKIPVLVIAPDSCRRLVESDVSVDSTKYVSVFLDQYDDELDRRIRERAGVAIDTSLYKQRSADRRYAASCVYELRVSDTQRAVELLQALLRLNFAGGVLPKRLIELMIENGALLGDADLSSVEPASYDLRLGDSFYSAGRIRQLSEADPILLIEPYDFTIVTSRETARIPRDISARFDLTVGLFSQGVILSNGPQVDPGYKGGLFCLLFNTSSRPVLLKRGQHYATIEFHRLVEPAPPYSGSRQSVDLVDYLPSNVVVGAVNELKRDLERVSGQTLQAQGVIFTVLSLVLAIAALFIATR